MNNYNRFNNPKTALEIMFNSAVARYKRKDNAGAANTIYNASRNLIPKNKDDSNGINLYKLQPLYGTIEDAIKAHSEGKTILTLRILKHIQLEFHYGRYRA